MTLIKLVLADDHAVVREGLKSLIQTQPDMMVIGEASDGVTALDAVRGCAPHILVVDISMPGLNGIGVTMQVRAMCPSVKVVALSAYEDLGYLRELLRAGAAGYVLKRSAAEVLIYAIRTVMSGGVYLDATLVAQFAQADPALNLSQARLDVALSEREDAVLQLIAQGYSNKEVAAQLGISIKTVETYKTRAMEKLELHSRVDLVRYAVQKGWLL
jgi:two-component system, NarL family, response regulator NreC